MVWHGIQNLQPESWQGVCGNTPSLASSEKNPGAKKWVTHVRFIHSPHHWLHGRIETDRMTWKRVGKVVKIENMEMSRICEKSTL